MLKMKNIQWKDGNSDINISLKILTGYMHEIAESDLHLDWSQIEWSPNYSTQLKTYSEEDEEQWTGKWSDEREEFTTTTNGWSIF